MKESDFRRELRKSFKHYFGRDVFSISMPSMYIEGGNADLYLCLDGKFISIECKLVKTLPKNPNSHILNYDFTPLQLERARCVKYAGGFTLGIICVKPLQCCVLLRDILSYHYISTEDIIGKNLPTIRRVNGYWEVNKIW